MAARQKNTSNAEGLVVLPLSAKEIGQRISFVRGKETQKDFAQRVGIKQNTISQYERGERIPTPDVLIRLHQACNITIEWLLVGEEGLSRGAPHGAGPPSVEQMRLDIEALKTIIGLVKEAIADGGYSVSITKEAEIIAGLYELCGTGITVSSISKSTIQRFLK